MLYEIANIVFWIYYHLFYRVRVEGFANVPKEGGVVFCANHLSVNDPILLCMLLKKKRNPVRLMGKQELFKNKFFGWVLRKLHAFPVNREKVEMSTFKEAIRTLTGGGALCLFAQGTRMKAFEASEAKAGVALFALKGNANVVPVYIDTTYRWFSRITVRFGEVMTLDAHRDGKVKTEAVNAAADEIMAEIVKLGEMGKKVAVETETKTKPA